MSRNLRVFGGHAVDTGVAGVRPNIQKRRGLTKDESLVYEVTERVLYPVVRFARYVSWDWVRPSLCNSAGNSPLLYFTRYKYLSLPLPIFSSFPSVMESRSRRVFRFLVIGIHSQLPINQHF